jgi:HTH-type transcriptional regulator/antitoxin HigA
MKTKKRQLSIKDLPRNFSALVAFHAPRPVRDEVDYENAIEIIDAMAGHNLTLDQDDYLDVLSTLVGEYEDKHHPLPESTSTPLERLKYLVEQAELSASDLGRLLGNRQLGAKLLCGDRELSKAHIRTLAAHFHIQAGYFL